MADNAQITVRFQTEPLDSVSGAGQCSKPAPPVLAAGLRCSTARGRQDFDAQVEPAQGGWVRSGLLGEGVGQVHERQACPAEGDKGTAPRRRSRKAGSASSAQ
jgi:hypothetical protein